MLRCTFIVNGTLPAAGLVLCNTTRSITELNVKLNHRRINDVIDLYGAVNALLLDFGNQRNTFALTARRDVDFSGAAFADPEAALLFALQQPGSLPTAGVLKIELQGAVTPLTAFYLLNCGVEGLNLADWLGVAPSFDYSFNGGLLTQAPPVFPLSL